MTNHSHSDDFITLIGADMAEINEAFRAQGLAEQDFAIVHRTGRHRFTRVDQAQHETMFDGRSMIAATYQRRSAS